MNKICSHPPTDFHYETSCFAALVWIDHVWSCVCKSEGLESGKDIHAITQSSHQTNNLASKAEICKKAVKKKIIQYRERKFGSSSLLFSPVWLCGFPSTFPFISRSTFKLSCGRCVWQSWGCCRTNARGGCNSLIWQCGDIGVWKCLLNA